MRTPALVAVDAEAGAYAALFAAAVAGGKRIGWLDLSSPPGAPPSVAGAAGAGAAKVVAVSADGALAWKRRRGEPVLRDLLREHFLGYVAVLVRGGEGLPRLAPSGDGFRFESAAGRRELSAAEVIAELSRPRNRA